MIDPEPRMAYSNAALIRSNEVEVTIDFLLVSVGRDNEIVSRVAMSPQQARILRDALDRNLRGESDKREGTN